MWPRPTCREPSLSMILPPLHRPMAWLLPWRQNKNKTIMTSDQDNNGVSLWMKFTEMPRSVADRIDGMPRSVADRIDGMPRSVADRIDRMPRSLADRSHRSSLRNTKNENKDAHIPHFSKYVNHPQYTRFYFSEYQKYNSFQRSFYLFELNLNIRGILFLKHKQICTWKNL